jgi:hypothetical protein
VRDGGGPTERPGPAESGQGPRLTEVRSAHLPVIHPARSSAISHLQHPVDWAVSGPSPRLARWSARAMTPAWDRPEVKDKWLVAEVARRGVDNYRSLVAGLRHDKAVHVGFRRASGGSGRAREARTPGQGGTTECVRPARGHGCANRSDAVAGPASMTPMSLRRPDVSDGTGSWKALPTPPPLRAAR